MDYPEVFSLRGRRALVTGGGSGLGFGVARCFVAAGAEVVLVGRDADTLSRAVGDLGPSAFAAVHDVTRVEEAPALARRVESERGPISILVNNAGNTCKKPIDEMTVEDFRRVTDTHVTGAFALSRAFLPQLERERGSILFTASMASYIGVPFIAGYSAAKAAYVGLVHALATELAPRGVRVNGVAPGWIDSAIFREATAADPARLAKIMGRIPMNRTGDAEDVGWAMTYLASSAAKYVTGHIVVVDGGALHGF